MNAYIVKYSWDNGDYFFLSGVYTSVLSAKMAMANGIKIYDLEDSDVTGEIIKLGDGLLSVIAEDVNSNETAIIGLFSSVEVALVAYKALTITDDVTGFGRNTEEYITPKIFYIIPQKIDDTFISPNNLY